MTPSPDLAGLLERVKQARGPSRLIDAEIVAALDLRPDYMPADYGPMVAVKDVYGTYVKTLDHPAEYAEFPQFSRSIDAAVDLIEKQLPGIAYRIQKNLDGLIWAELQRRNQEPTVEPFDIWVESGNRPSLPLALLAALLKAELARAECGA